MYPNYSTNVIHKVSKLMGKQKRTFLGTCFIVLIVKRILQSRVLNADFIVVYTGDVSHQHMWDGKDYAKKYEVPIYFAKTTTEKNMMQAYARALSNNTKKKSN